MLLDVTDDKQALIQVMAWPHQVASDYLSQCLSRTMLPIGIIRPQCVKLSSHPEPGDAIEFHRT